MSRSRLHRTAANTLIMDIFRSRALGIYMLQHPKALTLCWHSVDTGLMLWWRSVDAVLTLCWCSFWGVTVLTNTISPIKAANTSILDKCRSEALRLYKIQHTKSLTLCWRSFSDRCCDHVTIAFAQNGCQYVHYGHMLWESPWNIHDATPKTVDTLLTLRWHCVHALLMLCWWCVDALLTLILRCNSIDKPDNAYKVCQYFDYG